MAIRLRAARRGDEPAVAALHVRSWQEAYRGLMPAAFLAGLDPRERAERYAFGATEAGAPRTILAVAREEGAGGDEGGGGDPSLTNCGEVRPGSLPPPSEEALLGFVTFGRSRDADAEGLGEVYALYVDPEFHRGGVGRLLMREARRELVGAGFEEAILWVLQGNDRARDFYESEGWQPDGTSRIEQPYGILSTVHRLRRALNPTPCPPEGPGKTLNEPPRSS
ncbi:MAG TPA: GNAT family N-acetyltransferase [Solirubrobacterales bacterium]|nr:GNAT family N-acetyltransferase [Solirubrobacterales bacterium]